MTDNLQTLAPDTLYRTCNPSQFSFATTDELIAPIPIIGQDRAVASVRFGIGMKQKGYNLFALGPNGVGKYTTVRHYLNQQVKDEPTPSDWCYVHNFEQAHRPCALRLPAGKGADLCRDMEKLLDDLFSVIPTAFESEEYQIQKQAIAERLQKRQEDALEAINERVQGEGMAFLKTQQGFAFAPMREGNVISADEFQQLSDEEREQVEARITYFQDELKKLMRQAPQWGRESREELKQLDTEMATYCVAPLILELKERYTTFPDVVAYLAMVQDDVIENADRFLNTEESSAPMQATEDGLVFMSAPQPLTADSPFFNRYRANLLVDHSATKGAPVIYADHPTYQNVNGRVEHKAQMGALFTDFTLIKPGVLHEANGGYLILDAHKILLQPYTWESLKRALQAKEIKIEPLGQSLGLISTVTLEPEPIPLDVKVIMLGERYMYYLLHQLDPDFSELFKVAVDFDDEMDRNPENNLAYAHLISALVEKDNLRHFDRQAVARIIEYSSRLVSDAEKLSTHMQALADLLREANYWAQENGNGYVHASDVQRAIDAQKYRSGRVQERLQEAVLRDTIFIDTEGEVIGQVNALSVLSVGKHLFGQPSRITAQVYIGKGEVIDIERKAELGGPIHTKGVMILNGFLGGRYAKDRPLSLTASLVFEQHYSGIEGDSASSAELYALLSALAEAPIKQSLAVTGSVNQRGRIQAIGGVNEKIEGFFDICQARGLTGEQGVLIPAANVKNLMLRQDVVEAVTEGKFHIYPVATIDQGIEILTGIPGGALDKEGRYPRHSINWRVSDRLENLAQRQRAFSHNGHSETAKAAAPV